LVSSLLARVVRPLSLHDALPISQAGPAAIDHLVTGADYESAEVRQRAIRALDEVRRTTGPDELGSEAEGRIRDALRARLEDEDRSEEHTSELQSRGHLVCRLLLV